MRPFWLRPKWIVGHLLVVTLVVLFVTLGFWQLRRLDDKRDRIAVIAQRGELTVEPVGQVIAADDGPEAVAAAEWRRVTATGTYDAEGTVLVRNRSLNGQPGEHVLTPLVLADGTAVLVNRGWVPYAVDDPEAVLRDAEPPLGQVQVRGVLTASQQRGRFGPTDPEGRRVAQIARADVGRVQQQYDRPLLPAVLQLEEQRPPQAHDLPVVLPEQETDEGPHLSYAVQWFIFAAIGAVGWPVLLRRTGREERAGLLDEASGRPRPGGGGAVGVAQPMAGGGETATP